MTWRDKIAQIVKTGMYRNLKSLVPLAWLTKNTQRLKYTLNLGGEMKNEQYYFLVHYFAFAKAISRTPVS